MRRLGVLALAACRLPKEPQPGDEFRDAALEEQALARMTEVAAQAAHPLLADPRDVAVYLLDAAQHDAFCDETRRCEELKGRKWPGAYYDHRTGVWIVRDLIREDRIDRTLTHEVAHALEVHWPKCKVGGSDCELARSALREGVAMWAERVIHGHAGWWLPPDAPIEHMELVEDQRQIRYTVGDGFVRWLDSTGALHALTPERLPTTTAELMHPELWVSRWKPSLSCPGDGTRGEARIAYDLGPILGWERARAAAAGWEGDCMEAVGTSVEWTSHWATEADAAEFGAASAQRYAIEDPTGRVTCEGTRCVVRWATSAR